MGVFHWLSGEVLQRTIHALPGTWRSLERKSPDVAKARRLIGIQLRPYTEPVKRFARETLWPPVRRIYIPLKRKKSQAFTAVAQQAGKLARWYHGKHVLRTHFREAATAKGRFPKSTGLQYPPRFYPPSQAKTQPSPPGVKRPATSRLEGARRAEQPQTPAIFAKAREISRQKAATKVNETRTPSCTTTAKNQFVARVADKRTNSPPRQKSGATTPTRTAKSIPTSAPKGPRPGR